MLYHFVAKGFHTKKLSSRFLPEKYTIAFLAPPFGGLGAMYDVHINLIGKCIVDFLLVIIDFFSLGVIWVAASKNLLKISISHQPFFMSEN